MPRPLGFFTAVHFNGLPYTYLDSLTPQANVFFDRVRSIYLEQLHNLGVYSPVH